MLLRSVFPDVHVTINEMVSEGSAVAVHWTMEGSHTGRWLGTMPTGKRVTMTGIIIFHLEDGKIADVLCECDALGMLKQIGEVPRH